jgi:acetylornithine deacetylase
MGIDVIDLAQKLVGIPSESNKSNVPVFDTLCEVLDNAGFRIRRYPQRVFDEGTGPKENLVAERGNGPRRIVFSGHVDTVPVGDLSLWTHDPYGGDGIVDGRLYGRGSVDMKGQVAAASAACAVVEDVLDDLTLTLAFSADEETGHQGIKSLTSEHVFEDAVGTIVCEPTALAVIHAHKGAQTLSVDIGGLNCHSSQPSLGVNAIDQAMRLAHALEVNSRDWQSYRHPAFGPEPPTYSLVKIAGGIAHNVVPDACNVCINVRGLVSENLTTFRDVLDTTIEQLQHEDEVAGIESDRCFSADTAILILAPPMLTPDDSAWHRAVSGFIGQTESEFARYGTDGGVLSQVGMPCVVWGPGDIRRAHMPDEYITVDELNEAIERYSAFIRNAAGLDLPTVTTTLWDRPIRPT